MDPEHHREAVVGDRDAVREPAVEGADLVARANEKSIGAEPEARRCADAAFGQRREVVERALGGLDQEPALGGIGIEIVEVGVIGRVLQFAEEGDAVLEFEVVESDVPTAPGAQAACPR